MTTTPKGEQLRKAAERIRGTAKNPHLGLDEWYPVHPGDDAGIVTQRRAYHADVIAVAEFVTTEHPEPNPEHEKRAAEFRAAQRATADGAPEGTRAGIEQCARMLDTYGPGLYPANEKGQVAFARALMESTADEIRAYTANVATLLTEFRSAVADIARRIGPAASPEWVRAELERVLNEDKFRDS